MGAANHYPISGVKINQPFAVCLDGVYNKAQGQLYFYMNTDSTVHRNDKLEVSESKMSSV